MAAVLPPPPPPLPAIADPREQPVLVADFPAPLPGLVAAPVDVPVLMQNLINAGIPPLSTETYNRIIIADVINDNLYQQDVFAPGGIGPPIHHEGEVINAQNLENDLKKVLEKGLRIALPMDDPGQAARQAINTMGSAVFDMNNLGLLFNPVTIQTAVTNAVNSQIAGQTLANLHYEEIVPPGAITNMFGADGRELIQKNNLTVADMERVSTEYKRVIDTARNAAIAVGSTEREISNLLRQLSKWVDDHVENDQLKQILKNDARRVSGHRLSNLGFRVSNLVPEIVPLTLSKGIEIESSASRNEIEQLLNQVVINVDNVANTRQASRNLTHIVQELNNHAKLHRMRFQGPAVNGVVPPAELINIKLRHENNSPKSINELKAELRTVVNNFKNPKITFLRHATREADLPGVSETDFIRDLKNATERITRAARKPRIKTSTMPRPHRIKKIGNIFIRGDATNRKEIHIKPAAKKEDLIKLVFLLLGEPGALDDSHHNLLIKISKNTDPDKIYAILMQQLGSNLGHEFYLVYTPDSPVGGHFLDGMMDVFNHRPLIPVPPSLHGGRLSLGAMTSSGFIHSDPLQAFLNMPLHAFTPYRPTVLGRLGNIVQPINTKLLQGKNLGSVSNISRIPIDSF